MSSEYCKSLVIDCLKKFDKDHESFYNQNSSHLLTSIGRLGAEWRRCICTEERRFAGVDPRVDLYLQTENGHFLIETKLCVTSAGSVKKNLLAKAKATAEKLELQLVNLVLLLPRGASHRIYDKLVHYLMYLLSEYGVEIRVTGVEKVSVLDLQGVLGIRINSKRAEEVLQKIYRVGRILLLEV